jgi:hypothetical protein
MLHGWLVPWYWVGAIGIAGVLLGMLLMGVLAQASQASRREEALRDRTQRDLDPDRWRDPA